MAVYRVFAHGADDDVAFIVHAHCKVACDIERAGHGKTVDTNGSSIALLRNDRNEERKLPPSAAGAKASTYSDGSARKYATLSGSFDACPTDTVQFGSVMLESVHDVTIDAERQSMITVRASPTSSVVGGSSESAA